MITLTFPYGATLEFKIRKKIKSVDVPINGRVSYYSIRVIDHSTMLKKGKYLAEIAEGTFIEVAHSSYFVLD